MINVKQNKALLSIIISTLVVGTTQPAHFNWLTNNSIYKQGTELCSRLSKTDAYKQYAPYGNWLLKKAKERRATIAACLVGLFIARNVYNIYKYRKSIHIRNAQIKSRLKVDAHQNDLTAIIGHIQDGADYNTQSDEGITPLYLAVIQENWKTVKLFFKKHGADPNIQTNSGDSARQAVQRVQNIESKARIIDILNGNTEQYDELQRNKEAFREGLQRIHRLEVVSEDDWETIKQLIEERKVEVDCYFKQSEENGYSALYLAIEKECLDMVQWLIEHGTNVNKFPKNMKRDVEKPIIHAADKQNHEIFQAFVQAGVSDKTREYDPLDIFEGRELEVHPCGRRAIDILNGKQENQNLVEEEVFNRQQLSITREYYV